MVTKTKATVNFVLFHNFPDFPTTATDPFSRTFERWMNLYDPTRGCPDTFDRNGTSTTHLGRFGSGGGGGCAVLVTAFLDVERCGGIVTSIVVVVVVTVLVAVVVLVVAVVTVVLLLRLG